MSKKCIDCTWSFRPPSLNLESAVTAPDLVSVKQFAELRCKGEHLIVVGDGIEDGRAGTNSCWNERTLAEPGKHAFHCGPDARYFQHKEADMTR